MAAAPGEPSRTIAGATATALIGMFIFVLGIYVFLVDGKRLYAWLADHSPLSPAALSPLRERVH